MRQLFVIGLIAVAMSMTACSRFEEWDAPFVGYNVSNDNVVVVVNDGQEHPVPANRSVQFVVRVSVPKNPVPVGFFGTPTGPSTVDKIVQVSVAFRNLRTGRLTLPTICQAGAKVVTHVWYEMPSGGYESARCTSSY